MTRDEIISDLYRSGIIQSYCLKVTHGSLGSSIEDLVGEVFTVLCEVDPDKVVSLYDEGGMKKVGTYACAIVRTRVYYSPKDWKRKLRIIDDHLLLVDFDAKLRKYYKDIE